MTYRIYVKRKEELEGLKENFRKKHSEEERLKFDKNLNEIEHYLDNQEEKVTQCIDALYLSDEEKEIAKKYYIEGKSWKLAFDFSSMGKKLSDEERDKNIDDRMVESVKKQINRIIKKTIPEDKVDA